MKATRGGYSGTCCWHSSTSCDCGASIEDAKFMAGCRNPDGTDCGGGGWCCDSCATATWAEMCGF